MKAATHSTARARRPASPGSPTADAPDSSDSAALRQRIIAIAGQHFFVHGFSTITMDDLARELGMSKKTLYRYFPSKDDLLLAVIRAKAEEVRTTLEAIARDQSLKYPDKLRALIGGLVSRLAVIQPVFLHNLKKYAPACYAEMEKVRRENFYHVFKEFLEQGMASGQIRSDLNIPFTLEMVLGAFRTMLDPERLNSLQLTPAQALDMSFDLIFDGLITRKTKPSPK